jgi:hypothetical protein
MKKSIFLKAIIALVCCLSINFTVKSQNILSEDDVIANFGVGLLDFYGNDYSVLLPPISASLEYIMFDDLIDGNAAFGVGGLIGYSLNNRVILGNKREYAHFLVCGRGQLHYQFIDKLDTYAGLMIGWDIVSEQDTETASGTSPDFGKLGGFLPGFFVGGRYFFADNFAGFAEIGYGISVLQLGISLKF